MRAGSRAPPLVDGAPYLFAHTAQVFDSPAAERRDFEEPLALAATGRRRRTHHRADVALLFQAVESGVDSPHRNAPACGLFDELLNRHAVGGRAYRPDRQQREFLELAQPIALHGREDSTITSCIERKLSRKREPCTTKH